jgi:DNA-binding response OmpR family regulator
MGPAGTRRPVARPESILPTASPSGRAALKILVVEDEPKVAAALREGLEGEGYDVTLEHTGESAFFRATTERFDAILLDVMLPGRDGLTILTRLRDLRLKTPVLVLTARDTLEDRVRGLDAGADDYLVKPFAFAELLARVRALLRRGRADDELRLTVADLELDRVTRTVTRTSHPIELTAREFELLQYLMAHERQIVSRDSLARDVWKEPSRSAPLDNVIDVHIARLRRKIDADHEVKLIHTVRGVGFVLREDEP